MGIIKFNNVPSTTPGLEVETFPNYVAPEKEYQVTHVPGRNGDLVVDTKTYKNVPRSYKVSMAVEPPAVSVSGSTASFEATAERALAECKTAISSDVGKVGTTIINSVTDPVENNEPYNFRAVPNGVGDRENDTLIGGTVAWNQMVQNGNFATTTGWIAQTATLNGVSNNVADVSFSDNNGQLVHNISLTNGHKFFSCVDVKIPNTTNKITFFGGSSSAWTYKSSTATTEWQTLNLIWDTQTYSYVIIRNYYGGAVEHVLVRNCMIFDLTQMFGSTIADYIYGLETATAGAGVAWFRNLFPKDYYAYNPGELISVKTEAHKMIGFNQCDGQYEFGNINSQGVNDGQSKNYIRSTNYIRVLPNTTYCFDFSSTEGWLQIYVLQYDADNSLLSRGAIRSVSLVETSVTLTVLLSKQTHYIRFFLYKTPVYSENALNTVKTCINLSDPSKNGTYEPYEEHIYPLNPALELRGIPKLNSSNKLYYDGDIYSSDGSVIRKYGIVDLGSLDWSKATFSNNNWRFSCSLPSDFRQPTTAAEHANFVCSKYSYSNSPINGTTGFGASLYVNNSGFYVMDMNYSDTTAFKTAMSGVYLIYELATPVIESTTGLIDNVSIASFDDGADNVPVNLLESEIVAVQDLHGYDHPWPAGGGKNKANANNQTGSSNKHVKQYILHLPAGTYTVSAFCSSTADTDCAVLFIYTDDTNSPIQYLRNGNWSAVTINATKEVKHLNIYSSTGYSTSQNYTLTAINSLQVESGTTATSYEPYENICPITGFNSEVVSVFRVNLFDGILEKGYISTTTGEDTPNTSGNQWRCKNYIPVKPDMSLYMKLPKGYTTSNSNITVYYYDANKDFIGYESNKGNLVIQIPSNCYWFRFCNYIVTAIQNAPTENSLNYPSSDTQYHAYNGNTYTFTFGQTVYGGHFDNKGNLVVTHKIVDFGDLGYYYSNGRFSSTDIPDVKNVSVWNSALKLCSCYDITEVQTWTQGDFIIGMYGKNIYVKDSRYTDTASFKQGLTGQKFVVEFANPITLAITSQDIPTLLGNNHIFANTGNIKALSYPKQVCPFEPAQEVDDHGTEEYIDNREVAIPVGHESKYFTAGKIYNFSWLDEAGLIKEGELNADTGVLTITNGYKVVDIGDISWVYNASRVAFNVQITDIKTISSGTIGNMSCSIYTVSTAISSASDATNKPDMTIFQQNGNASVFIKNSSFTDAATFKSAMHGVKLLYELADPVRTIQLTPVQVESLIGHNVLISESGNISVTPRTYSTYTEKMNAISDWLHSASGYARLEDTYEPDYYRKAYYDEQTDMENIFNEAGQATLNFVCKPQRYLKSGEEPITISSGGLIQNRTRYEAYPILKVTTNNTQGSVAIGNHSITIKAGAGTDPITIDCELQDAWSGTSNKNSYIVLTDGEFPVIDPGTQTVTFDGGVQSVEVIPRWWTV